MNGVNETRRLKFDRPGLGTTATRDSDTIDDQNDLGSSDVHVVVVHVRELTATVIYTDIHRARDPLSCTISCGPTTSAGRRRRWRPVRPTR